MANIRSAKKRVRQSQKRRERNRAHRSELRTEIKKLRQAVAVLPWTSCHARSLSWAMV